MLTADYHPPALHREVLENYVADPALVDRLAARGLRAVRRGTTKLLVPDDGPPALYDLAADPLESHDLAAEAPAVVQELSRFLPPPHGTAQAAPPPETTEALRALGYVE